MRDAVVSLVTEVKNGSGEAFTRLSALYAPLLTSCISRCCPDMSQGDVAYDDMKQEALIALYNSAMSYDTEQDGVSFGLYAKICVTNRISSAVRKLRSVDEYTAELPDEYLDADDADPSIRLDDRESARLLLDRIASLLSDYERSVLGRSLRGMSISEISADTGRSVKSVDNALVRIRSKLRRLL